MRQKGLGRGLDAIFGGDDLDVGLKPASRMAEIDLVDIIPDPGQPRKQFDEAALDELSESIRQMGVIQPVTVRRSDDGKYIIISGERRWRASKKAGLERIPAYIREADHADVHAMALVENIQRQDLNAIEIAQSMQRLITECGLTQDALAEKMGKKRSSVSNYLRLLKLPEQVQQAVKEGVISMGHAKALAGAPADKQLPLLERCVAQAMSVRQIEDLVRRITEPKDTPEKAVKEDCPESYARLAEQLGHIFTQRVAIRRSKNGGGRIVINFKDDRDIDQFINRISSRG